MLTPLLSAHQYPVELRILYFILLFQMPQACLPGRFLLPYTEVLYNQVLEAVFSSLAYFLISLFLQLKEGKSESNLKDI